MNLKRLWDTENKKIVWAIPTGDPHKKLQVWTNDDGSKLYVYDHAQYLELDLTSVTTSEYGPVWKALDDEMVGYYLTNVPTELYNWDEGDEVSYTFKDYDGTVLKSGKVDEGTAPTPPADPTREADAQYTYTFAGWNPTVGNISKKTVYTATYTATVNEYTVNIFVNDSDMGYTEPGIINNVPYGTTITENEDHTVSVGDVTVTPIANEGYAFSSWGELPTSVTGATSITATFETAEYTVSIASNDETYGTVDVASVTADYGTTISASDNVLTIGETEVTATAETGYTFSSWGTLPATLTEDLSITATFTEE